MIKRDKFGELAYLIVNDKGSEKQPIIVSIHGKLDETLFCEE